MAVTTDVIRIMTSGTFAAALFGLIPQLERYAKKRIVTLTTSIGIGESFIPNRLRRGEIADIVIVADEVLCQCIEDGLVLQDGYTQLVRSVIGMAVRAGTPEPDISSLQALKSTLLRATSIGYSASVSGHYLVTDLCQRLGIVDLLKQKGRLIGDERVGTVVARGEVEIGFEQLSELIPVPGIGYIKPLPLEAQKVSTFSAGVAASSPDAALARAAIKFLASSDATKAITDSGLQPIRNCS